jgi:diaminopimelate epimerase
MNWSFTKMHGAGNDFVVLDGMRQPITLTPEQARAIAHRQFGIGCDQILWVAPPSHPEADFRYRIFNSDGSEVEHCGNGARCFVRFVHEQGLSSRNPLRAEISTGLITLESLANGDVRVEMGQVQTQPLDAGFDVSGLSTTTENEQTLYNLDLDLADHTSITVALAPLAISNPHAVQVVDDVNQTNVALIGATIESHPRFLQRVNAGFMQVINPHTIKLRVYERGAGETLACGTGACAAVITGIRRGLLVSPVRVQTRGGWLTIEWLNNHVFMTGPAMTTFSGTVDIDKLVASIPTF